MQRKHRVEGGGVKKSQYLSILALLVLLITACSGGTAPQVLAPSDPQAGGESDTAVDSAQPAQDPVELDAPVEGNQQPEPRQGLEATDPGSVVLASGQPQIVEFFAFW